MRKIRSGLLKLSIGLSEKRYKRLRYLLQAKHSSDTLIICFSGFGGEGPAKYNYVKTLHKIRANKLFILDDFGYKKRGSYYLGEDGDWFLPEMIRELIDKIRNERKIRHLVMVGSSKGGTAALYYAINLDADACIIGAPQYFIGDYLNTDEHKSVLNGIMGNTTDESIQKLNRVVANCVQSCSDPKPKVYIHYSPKEHTYPEHIEGMLNDLERFGYSFFEDSDYDYTDHGEVAKYFPQFLLRTLSKQLEEK